MSKRIWRLAAFAFFSFPAVFPVLKNQALAAPSENPKLAVLITGLSGGYDYKKSFLGSSRALHNMLRENGYGEDSIVVFNEQGSVGENGNELMATRENLESFFEGQAGKSEREQVVVFIAGHANGHDENAKLHLPGRDVDFKTLISWLDGIKTKQMIVVLATPQGEAWMKKFSRPGRVILAGNGLRKHNALPVMFLKFFPAELLTASSTAAEGESAEVSLADVFLRTHQKVMEWYRTNGLYPTEEPYLEADGDGKGIVPPADE
ncbi:MAG TPA: hypothetical protein VL688_06050, partial [Verrucomicrobiae bacterium]|nr:hypothetical protein [Verrucomicrobiae bacterium]